MRGGRGENGTRGDKSIADSWFAGNVIRITLYPATRGAARHEYEERMGKRIDPRKCRNV